jgi:hypothetical protein
MEGARWFAPSVPARRPLEVWRMRSRLDDSEKEILANLLRKLGNRAEDQPDGEKDEIPLKILGTAGR